MPHEGFTPLELAAADLYFLASDLMEPAETAEGQELVEAVEGEATYEAKKYSLLRPALIKAEKWDDYEGPDGQRTEYMRIQTTSLAGETSAITTSLFYQLVPGMEEDEEEVLHAVNITLSDTNVGVSSTQPEERDEIHLEVIKNTISDLKGMTAQGYKRIG
ncbi:MAG: hypothetical protein JWO47_151 [Candidatus Saccharibacteria bacterium]|nr:hypothetical protein [Candidatus Saccharibacteria bacterium]